MIPKEDIEEALRICEAASKGVAVWAADRNDTRRTAIDRFIEHLDKAMAVTGSAVSHQVDLVDQQTEADGTALCFAVTGNGPKGGENARFIAAALHPTSGFGAALRELAALRSLARQALDLARDFNARNDPADAWMISQRVEELLDGVA